MEKMTAAQFLQAQDAPKKPSKYGNRKVTVCGIEFDSKREADRYLVLKDKERAGLIINLKLQLKIPLMGETGQLIGANSRGLVYIADFAYVCSDTRETVIEDAKGFATDVYKLKKAILRGQGIEIIEV